MLPSLSLLPDSIPEILATVSETGKISQTDRYGLMAAMLEESLGEEETRAINRLLRAINRGRIKIIP
ncbi:MULTISPECIES: hypothetical protein [Spirulina sp. CCY15215]|uniref:hypothetical protein n=1 Tax=Spirulina sp. CCY15215 TaxID=2767591 RepID=UPI00194F126C|nr:hypothetical protein [Spirulina major]